MARLLLPLGVFLVLAVFLAVGLRLNPREVPSPFVGKPAPQFAAPVLGAPDQVRKRDDLLGQVWILNVWASWCAPCREEHPLLVDYARQPDAAARWLQQLGNPYAQTLVDPEGRIGIDYGVYGVPETFVIDKTGVVRMKHIGPLTPEVLRDKLVPLLRQLGA
jgi:cytochrome c biogenesis protein CcmG/thiol:disulfide interchange protein DsbE